MLSKSAARTISRCVISEGDRVRVMFSIPQIYDKHFEWPNMVGENNGGYFFFNNPPTKIRRKF
jgi:hypothetical protein